MDITQTNPKPITLHSIISPIITLHSITPSHHRNQCHVTTITPTPPLLLHHSIPHNHIHSSPPQHSNFSPSLLNPTSPPPPPLLSRRALPRKNSTDLPEKRATTTFLNFNIQQTAKLLLLDLDHVVLGLFLFIYFFLVFPSFLKFFLHFLRF